MLFPRRAKPRLAQTKLSINASDLFFEPCQVGDFVIADLQHKYFLVSQGRPSSPCVSEDCAFHSKIESGISLDGVPLKPEHISTDNTNDMH